MTDSASLDAIEPASEVIIIDGTEYRIGPLTVGQLPAFSRAIAPAVPALQALFSKVSGEDGFTIDAVDILATLEASESVIEAVSIAARVDREVLDRQGLDVLVKLAGAVFQVNADFFGRALAPAAVAVVERAVTGTESSSGLSVPDSPGLTS